MEKPIILYCVLSVFVIILAYLFIESCFSKKTYEALDTSTSACISDPNKPKPFNIKVHYSNYNANM